MRILHAILLSLLMTLLVSSVVYCYTSDDIDFNFDECEFLGDNPYEMEDLTAIPTGGITYDTTCGPATLGFRMMEDNSIEGYTSVYCIFTGNFNLCYWDFVGIH